MSFPSDLEIARSVTPRPIVDVAARPRHRATTSSSCTARPRPRSRSRRSSGSRPSARAASTSSSPRSPRRRSARASRRPRSGSPRASTTSASRAAVNIRQPSLGPVFGIKGGAAGGGYSQVIPMEDFNLHLTGDVHAIGAAHNLAGAFLDNSLHHKNPLGHRPARDPLAARRRHQRPGAAPRRHRPRRARGRRSRARPSSSSPSARRSWRSSPSPPTCSTCARGSAGSSSRPRRDGTPVTAEDLGVAGSMTVLLRDAIKPNLLQTLEGGPAFVHCRAVRQHRPRQQLDHRRPARAGDQRHRLHRGRLRGRHGRREVLRHQVPGVRPRARMRPSWSPRSGRSRCTAASARSWPASRSIRRCSRRTSRRSGSVPQNLAKQIENVTMFGVPAVVAINSFPTDTPAEVEAIREVALAAGARDAVVATHFVDGGDGRGGPRRGGLGGDPGRERRLPAALPGRDAARPRRSRRSRPGSTARDGVEFLPAARKSLKQYEDLGYGHLPVCMAKTQYSLSHDAALKGRPTGFTVPIREVRLSAGAGFITPLCGEMRTMPGLPSRAGRREDRHRRRREHRRPVLGPVRPRLAAPAATVSRGRPSPSRSRTRRRAPSAMPSTPAPQAATSIGPSGSSPWAWSSWPWSSPWSSVR